MSDEERELEPGQIPEENKLPPWHRPEMKKISLRETLNHVGSGGDAGHSESL